MKTPFLIALCSLCVLGAGGLALFVLGGANESPSEGLEPVTQVAPDREVRSNTAGAERRPVPDEESSERREREPVVVATPTGGGLADPLDRPRGVTPEEQRRRLEQQVRIRAERVANELGLASGAEEQLSAVMLESHDKLQALRADFIAGSRSPEARTELREAMAAIPAWRLQRWTELYGETNAAAIEAFDDTAAAAESGHLRSDTDD